MERVDVRSLSLFCQNGRMICGMLLNNVPVDGSLLSVTFEHFRVLWATVYISDPSLLSTLFKYVLQMSKPPNLRIMCFQRKKQIMAEVILQFLLKLNSGVTAGPTEYCYFISLGPSEDLQIMVF
jgi:hypothetical protein